VGVVALAAPAVAEMGLTVRQLESAARRITIPINKSVIIETTEPVTRVQSVETGIAKIESLSPKQQIVTGVSYGTTQVMLWSEDGDREVVDVQVELDVALLNEKLREIDPQSKVTATSVKGHILLSGTVSGALAAEQIERFAALFIPATGTDPSAFVQNHLMVAGQQQVLLRCTVAEVNRRALRRLGVDGFLAGDDFADVFAVSQIGGFNPINIGAAADVNATSTIPFLTGEDGIPLSPNTTFSLGFPRVQMQLFIRALQENSLLRILAEPDLVAISGETASFLAGGEFPIPVPQSGASTGAITIEFREFGVRVNFTPVVLSGQRIRLKVAPEVSETDFSTAVQIQGFVVPGLTQRRVETVVEVGNGQTLAVAGLLADEIRGVASKLPALGEVPILGALFRSVEYQRRETELVILVTPEIIAPMDPQQVPSVPGEDYLPPNDYELYALGMVEGEVDQPEAPLPPDAAFPTAAPPKVAPLRSQPQDTALQGPWGYSSGNE
jgi:pilus assembly protein CpaC